jgi:hypothetical protein
MADSPYQSAVNCVAAIRSTRAALAAANVSLGAAGQKSLEQAEKIFVDRARATNLQAATASKDITDRQDATKDQPGEQAQLPLAVLACDPVTALHT